MFEQAPTFEQSGIRFAEDHPVVLPCLQKALAIFFKQDHDPKVFRMLMHFFSRILQAPTSYRHRHDYISLIWNNFQNELTNPHHSCYGGQLASMRLKTILDQLDPIETSKQIWQYGHVHMQDNAPDRNPADEGYTVTSREHDWITRCAFQVDIPCEWKMWLQRMYVKQPYLILDMPSTTIDEDEDIFLATLHAAAAIGGFGTMVPVIKFWLRQALTIIQVWDVQSRTKGDAEELTPSYDWCVAAYQKMWHGFKNEVRNPLSEYPYAVRDQLLSNLHFMRIFEECWRWINDATEGMKAHDFAPYKTREVVYKHILTLACNEFQPHGICTPEQVEQAFGASIENIGYPLLVEGPVVYVDNVQAELFPRRALYDGLCQEFYPSIPAEPEYDAALYVEEHSSDEYEPVPLDDVEVEAFGPLIDIAHFTRNKESDAGDYCTICQEDITLDVFHAQCLEAWVNSTAKICNTCPHCKKRMTKYQRPVRAIESDGDERMA